MGKMDYRPEEIENMDATSKAAEISSRSSLKVMRRTPRMFHESSFATSAFTSSRIQKRPPGFAASSLDFESRTNGVLHTDNDVTTKPGRKKKHNSEQQEQQLERAKQDKQRRQYRSRHPTRAQGNFGPPPHAIDSLKDLENLSEEQIYKLFTDDPNFHQKLIDATEKVDHEKKSVPSSAPAGARKGRNSTGRKPSYSPTKNRKTINTKIMHSKDIDREVPYLQWLFVFILIGAVMYKIFKFDGTPISTKAFGGISDKVIRRKIKSKKGRKPGKKITARKNGIEDNAKQKITANDGSVSVKKKSSSRKKKKKTKVSVTGSEILSNSQFGKETRNASTEMTDEQPKPSLDTTDESSRNILSEKTKLDVSIEIEPDSSPTFNENDGAWQTVTKTSKGIRKGKKIVDMNHVEEKKVFMQPVVQNMKDEGKVVGKNNEATEILDENRNLESLPIPVEEKVVVKNDISSDGTENTDIPQTDTATRNGTEHTVVENNTTSKTKDSDKSNNDAKQKSLTTTENDAALALQLHEEEVKLASGNCKTEVWEEVTIKKRKA